MVILGGEVLQAKQLNRWRRALPQVQYVNLYGPTEVTVDCTYYFIDREFDDTETIPIGKACGNMDVFCWIPTKIPCRKVPPANCASGAAVWPSDITAIGSELPARSSKIRKIRGTLTGSTERAIWQLRMPPAISVSSAGKTIRSNTVDTGLNWGNRSRFKRPAEIGRRSMPV